MKIDLQANICGEANQVFNGLLTPELLWLCDLSVRDSKNAGFPFRSTRKPSPEKRGVLKFAGKKFSGSRDAARLPLIGVMVHDTGLCPSIYPLSVTIQD